MITTQIIEARLSVIRADIAKLRAAGNSAGAHLAVESELMLLLAVMRGEMRWVDYVAP